MTEYTIPDLTTEETVFVGPRSDTYLKKNVGRPEADGVIEGE